MLEQALRMTSISSQTCLTPGVLARSQVYFGLTRINVNLKFSSVLIYCKYRTEVMKYSRILSLLPQGEKSFFFNFQVKQPLCVFLVIKNICNLTV
jgi:hypothetical protein